jgi:hypothetical protein
MGKFKSIYTELLQSAMEIAYEQELYAITDHDKKEWAELNRFCRVELYKGKEKIEPIKKSLDSESEG